MRGIGENMGRLSLPSGKYVALVLSDYTAVDFSSSTAGQPININIKVSQANDMMEEYIRSHQYCF